MNALALARGLSRVKACRLLGVARSSFYYEPTTRAPAPLDPEVREAVFEVARERPSYGYRRVTAHVRRNLGRRVNRKKVHRIMKKENLLARACFTPRRRLPKHPGRLITERPDTAWQMDMKYVWCGDRDGWGYLQSIVDTCTSEWLGYVFSKRCGAREAIEVLDRVCLERFPESGRAPGTRLRVDNGSSYKADRFNDHAAELGFIVEHIQVKTPEDNGMIESFHSNLERDYLRLVGFESFDDARTTLPVWIKDYNEARLMERLGWRSPAEYRQHLLETIESTE